MRKQLEPPTISIEIDKNGYGKEFLKSIESGLTYIGAARVEGKKIHVVGYKLSGWDSTIKDYFEIIKDMHKTFYGVDEFIIKDINGSILYFGEAQNE